MYYLKLYDENLLSFDMDNKFGLNVSNIKILSENRDLFPIKLKEVNENNLVDFIESKIIPRNRIFVNAILESSGLNINDKKSIIDVSKGLSLTDSYWIVKDNTYKFSDFNLFNNDFSSVLSLVAFTGYSSKISDLITSPEYTTNGMLPKAWRRVNNGVYLYKGSTYAYHFANTGFEPFCEFYASQVAKKMEISYVSYDIEKWKGMVSSTCPLFTDVDTSFVQIADVVKTGGIKKVYEYLCEIGLEEKFEDMILFDALCMNTDRHFGNFGLLRDNHSGEFIDFAPVFDNGESLLSKAMPNIFKKREEFISYINRSDVNISYYGVSYDDLVKEFCKKRHIKMLRKLVDFKFEKHKRYNLDSKRLDCLSLMIRLRAQRFIEILEKM